MQQTVGGGIRKAVLIAIADNANRQTGECELSLQKLAEETEFTRKAISRAVDGLVEDGFIRRERVLVEGLRRGWRFLFTAPVESDRLDTVESDRLDSTSLSTRQQSDPRARNQDLDLQGLQEVQELTSTEGGGSSRGEEVQDFLTEADCATFETCPIRAPRQVNRQRVGNAEGQLAILILKSFNEVFGTRYKAKDHVASIIMRCREHSELSLQDHRDIQVAARANPWWRGNAQPRVVYGSAGLFENRIAELHGAQRKGIRRDGRMTRMELLIAERARRQTA